MALGITHTVSVSASSLYEAAGLALAKFEKCGFAMMIAGLVIYALSHSRPSPASSPSAVQNVNRA